MHKSTVTCDAQEYDTFTKDGEAYMTRESYLPLCNSCNWPPTDNLTHITWLSSLTSAFSQRSPATCMMIGKPESDVCNSIYVRTKDSEGQNANLLLWGKYQLSVCFCICHHVINSCIDLLYCKPSPHVSAIRKLGKELGDNIGLSNMYHLSFES